MQPELTESEYIAARAEYDAGKRDNDLTGKIEQFEILRDMPEEIFAYAGKAKGNGMGCDRVIGQGYPITVWTGLQIGNATCGASWRVNSFTGSRMYQFYARINGREYTGRVFGKGMCIRLKETAQSKRSRSLK